MKRRVLLLLMLIGFVVLVVSHRAEIQELLVTLSAGQSRWVAIAALLQLLYAVLYAALHQASFAVVEVQSRTSELLPLLFASTFVNVASPMTGAAGIALFADDAARRGQSPTRSAVGSVLVMLSDFIAFALVLVAGMAFLARYHALQTYQLLAAGILLATTGALVGMLALGLSGPTLPRRLLGWVQGAVNRLAQTLGRPAFLKANWARCNADEFGAAAQAIVTRPWRLLQALSWALTMHFSDLLTVYVLFLAFHHRVSLDVLVAGYAMGMLFWIVAVTPSGVGVVEGVMTATFASLGVPLPTATAVVLTFRGLGFWLPVAIGFLTLRRVRTFGAAERPRGMLWRMRDALPLALTWRVWERQPMHALGALFIVELATLRWMLPGVAFGLNVAILALTWWLWYLSARPRARTEPPPCGSWLQKVTWNPVLGKSWVLCFSKTPGAANRRLATLIPLLQTPPR